MRIGRIGCVHAEFAEIAEFASTAGRFAVWAMCSMCRTELAHDVRLSLLKSRRGAAASAHASAGAKRAYSVLRRSMKKD